MNAVMKDQDATPELFSTVYHAVTFSSSPPAFAFPASQIDSCMSIAACCCRPARSLDTLHQAIPYLTSLPALTEVYKLNDSKLTIRVNTFFILILSDIERYSRLIKKPFLSAHNKLNLINV